MGSLKSFRTSGEGSSGGGAAAFAAFTKGKRLFGSSPDLAASMPAHFHRGVPAPTAPMALAGGRRRVAPLDRNNSASNLMGTSMPISIPMMQRRPSGADLAAGGGSGSAGGGGARFVPPHVLYRQTSESHRDGPLGGLPDESGLSPTTAAKRERLLARNAILRSTGFIEGQHTAAPIVIGAPPAARRGLLGAGTRWLGGRGAHRAGAAADGENEKGWLPPSRAAAGPDADPSGSFCPLLQARCWIL